MTANGLLPGWRHVSLREVAPQSTVKVDPQSTPETPFIGMEHVEAQTMQLLATARCADYRSAANAFSTGDVLYGRLRPYLNKVLLATFSGACSGEFIVLRPTADIRASYLAQLMNHRAFVTFAGTLDAGDRPRVRYEQIANYELALPPVSEQDAILELLSEYTRHIDEARRDAAAAENGIARMRTSALHLLVEGGWETRRIHEVGEVFVGATPKRGVREYWGGDIPWVSSSEVAFCRIGSTKEHITEAGLGNRQRRLHPLGTVLLAMYGEGKTRGQAAILDIEAATNQAVAAVRVDESKMLPSFLYLSLMRQYDEVRKFGRGGQQLNLNKDLVRGIEVPCPPVDVQQELIDRIELLLRTADEAERTLVSVREQANQVRTALVRDALAGRLSQRAEAGLLVEAA